LGIENISALQQSNIKEINHGIGGVLLKRNLKKGMYGGCGVDKSGS
jgi:hypothetical protein